MVNWGKDDDAFPDDRCCATRIVYRDAPRPMERPSYEPPRFCKLHNVDGTCAQCAVVVAAEKQRALDIVGGCAHRQLAGSFCIHCNRVVPRAGEVTTSDRVRAAELANLPMPSRESAIAQALANARVDLRVKQP